jgi:dissimilatory sulfite reductase (desulfoviridin) alpha/beta subunit
MLWFLRGIRKGVVTSRYPARPDLSTAGLPSPPVFRSDLLTPELADRLAAVCPAGALRRDRTELVLDLGACTGCGRCSELAGAAVAPSGEFELAARDRAALLKRIPIGGER